MSKHSVLFIDDDEGVLRSLGNYFEKIGHTVHRAATGKEGLDLHERVRPDVTVLDLSMPDMSGLEVLEVLRTRGAMVIMLTAHGEVDAAVEAMRLGAENFLTKPIEMSHLVATVEKAAEKVALREENVALRMRLHPSMRRRVVKLVFFLVLIGVAAVLGRFIGGGRVDQARPRAAIPVPLDAVGEPDTSLPVTQSQADSGQSKP